MESQEYAVRFVDQHRAELTERVRAVDAIGRGLLAYGLVRNRLTMPLRGSSQNKMKNIYQDLDFRGAPAKEAFYKLLKEHEPQLLQELENVSGEIQSHREELQHLKEEREKERRELEVWRAARETEEMELQHLKEEREKERRELEAWRAARETEEMELQHLKEEREKERRELEVWRAARETEEMELQHLKEEREKERRELEAWRAARETEEMELHQMRCELQREREEVEKMREEVEKMREEVEKMRDMMEKEKEFMTRKDKTQSESVEAQKSPFRKCHSMEYILTFTAGETPGTDASIPASVPELRLVLLGRNTAEKSLIANGILGREVFVSGTPSPTKAQMSSQRKHGTIAGRRVVVVNTPDWFSSTVSQFELWQDVKHCMELSAPGPHAFLLVTEMLSTHHRPSDSCQ
ncbi:uncharacterized protein [Paramormyrops kingsleyae]|uniref:uncharacterized protein n=1 Tax=Paramormyrops kingsleyae TaxID=1676925 RepID=UPI003B97655A